MIILSPHVAVYAPTAQTPLATTGSIILSQLQNKSISIPQDHTMDSKDKISQAPF
jgi:hypothetical protein